MIIQRDSRGCSKGGAIGEEAGGSKEEQGWSMRDEARWREVDYSVVS